MWREFAEAVFDLAHVTALAPPSATACRYGLVEA